MLSLLLLTFLVHNLNIPCALNLKRSAIFWNSFSWVSALSSCAPFPSASSIFAVWSHIRFLSFFIFYNWLAMLHSVLQFLNEFIFPSTSLFLHLIPHPLSFLNVLGSFCSMCERGETCQNRNSISEKHKRWIQAYPDNKAMSFLKDPFRNI